MKVKIGNKIYSAEDQPILLILTQEDKQNIAKMSTSANKYCAFPDLLSTLDVKKWVSAPAKRKVPLLCRLFHKWEVDGEAKTSRLVRHDCARCGMARTSFFSTADGYYAPGKPYWPNDPDSPVKTRID